MRFLLPLLALASTATVHAAMPGQATPNAPPADIRQIVNQVKNVIVLYMENQSFDGLLPFYPGADGLQAFHLQDGAFEFPQKNKYGELYNNTGSVPRQWMPAGQSDYVVNATVARMMPNAPWDAKTGKFPIDPAAVYGDLTHRFYEEQYQINNQQNQTGKCKLDQFLAFSTGGPLIMGYFDETNSVFGQIAKQGVLLDHFHHSAFGGSYLNHQFLIAAQASRYVTNNMTTSEQNNAFLPPGLMINGTLVTSQTVIANASWWPASTPTAMDNKLFYPYIDPELIAAGLPTTMANGLPIYHSNPGPSPTLTPDDYAINTIYPPVPVAMRPKTGTPYAPYFQSNITTIGDILTNNSISWAWYADAWNLYLSDPTYSTAAPTPHNNSNPLALHHQPFMFHQRFADLNSTDSKMHLKDEDDFFAALASGTGLPQVSFVKPNSGEDYHPSYGGGVQTGNAKLQEYMDAIKKSSYWSNTAVIITFDENGGRFDHVCPPVGDRWGPGLRVPSILLSPLVTPGTIDHNTYETLSILRLLTTRFNLTTDIIASNAPARTSTVNDLSWAFAPSTPMPAVSSSSSTATSTGTSTGPSTGATSSTPAPAGSSSSSSTGPIGSASTLSTSMSLILACATVMMRLFQ